MDFSTADEPQPARLYLFGHFRLERDGDPQALRTRKTESLLAYLILHPQAQAREYLAGLLWGEARDDAARSSLRQELAALRRVLGDDLLLADRQTVQINPDYALWVDVTAFCQYLDSPAVDFEDWRAAVSLYSDDLLVDCYDDWVLVEREHLRQQYRKALLSLAQYYRSHSDYGEAIRLAQMALRAEPADERAHQHLIMCYAASGDRAAALMQYETCCRSLQDYLGVEPSPETQALHRSIQKMHARAQAAQAQLTNLPLPTTSFVGRAEVLEAVENLLQPLERGAESETRLLTLSGMGGSGKTRLAIEVGRELVDAYRDGVWWVELGALNEPEMALPAVAAALGVRQAPSDALDAALLAHLGERNVLLVLDNCEHLLNACARLVDQILSACQHVQILATSREALRVPGEMVWMLQPLALPEPGSRHDLAALMAVESVRLFSERAAAVYPAFKLSMENAEAVSELCQRLDGLPLAIELAAARVRALTPAQINARLGDRFRLLSAGSRTAQPRQQTLRALVDWSHNLLSHQQQVLFRRLAVFAGGWTLEAAESICAGGDRYKGPDAEGDERLDVYEVLDLLSSLVDKSLVVAHERGGAMRYAYLETLRGYAYERLEESGEANPVHARQLDYYLGLAEAGGAAISAGQEQAAWMERLGADQENLRQALEWAVGHDAPRSLQLAGALWPFWEVGGRFGEGQGWLEQALDASGQEGDIALRARALSRAGTLAWQQGDVQRAEALHESALELYRQAKDAMGIASSLNNLAAQVHAQGKYERAALLYEQAVGAARQIGDLRVSSAALNNLGIVMMEMKDYGRARQYLKETMEITAQMGNQVRTAIALHNLAEVALLQGDTSQALEWYSQSLAESRQLGYQQGVMMNFWGCGAILFLQEAYPEAMQKLRQSLHLALELGAQDWAVRCLAWLGLALARQDQSAQAARLLGTVESLNPSKVELAPGDIYREAYESVLAALRASLGEAELQQAWAHGAAMSLDEAVTAAAIPDNNDILGLQ